jgi:hypothetical protein
MSSSKIFIEIFFGMVGMAYCYSGKRRGNGRMFACGLVLGIFPYFVDSLLLLSALGLALTGFPIVFRD